MSDAGATSIPNQAIIVLCLVGAGALVLICYAVGRHFYGQHEPQTNLEVATAHDGMSQLQYMRLVRTRNHDDLSRTYGGPMRESQSYAQSKYPMSSITSEV
jgi:hypothetical protein